MTRPKVFPIDRVLFAVVLAMTTFGVVMVYDASYPTALAISDYGGDRFFFLKRQLGASILGLIGMLGLMFLPYEHLVGAGKKYPEWLRTALKALPWIVYGITVLLLVYVMVKGHGAQGAQRWIKIGPIKLQPSEVIKPAMVIFFAHVIATWRRYTLETWQGIVFLVIAAGLPMALTTIQPDLGSAITLFLTFMGVVFVSGARGRTIASIIAVFAVGAALAIAVPHKKAKTVAESPEVSALRAEQPKQNFRVMRLLAFLDPESHKESAAFQNWHGLIALGSGGTAGLGFGESREKRLGGVPAQRTDFIFAIVGEEFGLLGTLPLLAGFLILGFRGFSIACQCRDPLGRYLAAGITTSIFGQALLNIAVVTSSVPTTGIPLPLISYGGSSLVSTLWMLGVLLNVSRYPYIPVERAIEKPRASMAVINRVAKRG